MLDLLITADRILTLDPERPEARRMGVLGGRIVGFDEHVDGLEARSTESFPGRTIVPGFIDAHCHTTWWGLGLNGAPVAAARGLEEFYDVLRAEVAKLDEDEWVYGIGFNERHHGGAIPDLATVDEITGSRPMYIRNESGHSALTNTATLRRIGAFAEDYRDPEGGALVRDAAGRYTGLVEETAQSLLQALLVPYSQERIVAALDTATAKYAEQGITSFAEAGVGGGWIGHSPVEIAAYQAAKEQGRLHARAQLMPAIDAVQPISGNAEDFAGEGSGAGFTLGVRTGFGDARLSLGPVKVFTDGSLLGATAAVTESFCGHEHNLGYLQASPEELREQVRAVYRAGWRIAVHAIGDAAIDLALDLIEECQEAYGMPTPVAGEHAPNRVEHFGIARPDQIERAARLRIAVTPQHGFIRTFGSRMVERVGEGRRALLYRGKRLAEAGVVVAGSSDSPVVDNNVRDAMQAAVERIADDGSVIGEGEGFTREEALRLYTEWGARATGQLADRGTLSPGKLADFVVLDRSPLKAEHLGELRIEATFMGGDATYDARG
ncbi:amidohydrolase [Gulosibacter sp. 10]|uniref:amidohydrolase n=1 Tax=Gulosibacter sp. 10 TaxID=1255570 RepID=UPI00097EF331|nr:amidohydrolase [Gulosibacter sp. 10]SJM67294.1 Exoenzymes regulatory protein AepA precursor [Gulosibacter sp. 10]